MDHKNVIQRIHHLPRTEQLGNLHAEINDDGRHLIKYRKHQHTQKPQSPGTVLR